MIRIQVMEYLHWGADGQRGMEGNSLLVCLFVKLLFGYSCEILDNFIC